jgi:hypothetical protein
MRWLWFSIASVVALVLYAAIGLAAYANVGDRWYGRVWDDAYFMITVFILAIATILAVLRRGRTRAMWLGFAVFGWIHLMFGWPDSGGSPRGADGDTYRPRFPHMTLIEWAIQGAIITGRSHGLEGDYTWHVLQSTVTLATAVVGAFVGGFLWRRSEVPGGESGDDSIGGRDSPGSASP